VTTGWTGAWGRNDGSGCFYVIATATADISRAVCDLPQRVNQIGFSPDGQYIIALMKGTAANKDHGLRIYRMSDFSLYRTDTDYADSGIAFDFIKPAGTLVTSSLDVKLRLYDKDFRLIKAQTLPDGRKPHGIAVSPDGSRIAVGYAEPEGNDPAWQPAIDVLSSADLSVLFRPDVRGMKNAALWRVAWSQDGQFLYAGGTWQKGERFPIRRWSDGGKSRPLDNAGTTDRIIRMSGAPPGILFATETGGVGLLGFDDQLVREQVPATADFTDIGDALAISADGNSVQFAFEPAGRHIMHFSLTTRRLEEGAAPASAGLSHPITDSQKLDVRDWAWSYAPMLNGAPLAMRPHDQSLSLTLLTGDTGVMLGTSWQLIVTIPVAKSSGRTTSSAMYAAW
jgi:dipeptidyl aminopeptidase/acylaminoacyl peptidase